MLWNPGSRYTIGALRPAILSEAEERKRVPEPARATRSGNSSTADPSGTTR
jgi:hypothetical protein